MGIELVVDDDEVWITDGHQKLEFYELKEEEKVQVMSEIKSLDKKLEFLKNYTGFYFKSDS